MGSPLDVLEVCGKEREVLRKECRLEMCREKELDSVTRLRKSGGDVEPHVVSRALVEQPCRINSVDGCKNELEGLWKCSCTCIIMYKFFSGSGY